MGGRREVDAASRRSRKRGKRPMMRRRGASSIVRRRMGARRSRVARGTSDVCDCLSASKPKALGLWCTLRTSGRGCTRRVVFVVSFFSPGAPRRRVFDSTADDDAIRPSVCFFQVAPRAPAASTRRTAVVVNAGLKPGDLKPQGNRVLVIPDAAETKTKGGILLTTGTAGASGPGSSLVGKVQSIGPDVKACKSGDKVLINGFAGSDVEFEDGSKGKFITIDDVIAVVSA